MSSARDCLEVPAVAQVRGGVFERLVDPGDAPLQRAPDRAGAGGQRAAASSSGRSSPSVRDCSPRIARSLLATKSVTAS